MQPQELTSEPSILSSWIDVELFSLLQLSFFLMLGYAAGRWIWSLSASRTKVFVKKVDDVNELQEESQGSESDAALTSKEKSSARRSNLRERKRIRNTKEVTEEVQHPPRPCSEDLEVKAPHEEPQEAPAKVPQEVPQDVPQEAPQEEPRVAVVSERVAKMMAKKMERKARKLAEDKARKEEEEKSQSMTGGCDKRLENVAIVEAYSDAEALSDDMAQIASTTSMVPAPKKHLPAEGQDRWERPVPCIPKLVLDNIQTATETVHAVQEDTIDSVVASPEVPSIVVEGISTPERCLTPSGDLSPSMWCDGWMAVAIPAEFAPPGAPGPFDGLWSNEADERIVIDHDDIKFESGMEWKLKMQSLTNLSVQVGDEEFTAELDTANQRLVWSDGDVWTCMGETDGQKAWSAAREAQGMPCVLYEGEQLVHMNAMAMPAPFPMLNSQIIPEEAESWEICWDWSKKGWCNRANCEWYHPVQQYQPCPPCDPSAPFSELMGEPCGLSF